MIRKHLHSVASGRHNRARQKALNELRKRHPHEWLQEYRKAENALLERYLREYRELKLMFYDDIVTDEKPVDHRRNRVVTANLADRRYNCPHCGAKQNEPCRSTNGDWRKTHAARKALNVTWIDPRTITCPVCWAKPGSSCHNVKTGKSHAPHAERRRVPRERELK